MRTKKLEKFDYAEAIKKLLLHINADEQLDTTFARPRSFFVKSLIQEDCADALSLDLAISYLFLGRFHSESFPNVSSGSRLAHSIRAEGLNLEKVNVLRKLVRKIYFKEYAEYISQNECGKVEDKLSEFLKISDVAILYKKGDEAVGALMLKRQVAHLELKAESLHIGFVGYDRSQLTKTEARIIKENWIAEIQKNLPKSNLVSANIYWYNFPSIQFHERLGLAPRVVKISRNE